MESIILFRHSDERISIHIDLYFDPRGQLVLEGQDIGQKVEEFWGSDENEYGFTVDPGEVQKLNSLMGLDSGNRSGLLGELKRRFGGNKAFSNLCDFMEVNGIDYDSSIWA